IEQNKRIISCEFCGKTFKFQATLYQHEKVHYGIKQHECEVCHRRFLHKSTLKCHLRLHTGEKPYQCPHCTKTFRGQTALNCHIFHHTKQGVKCPQCSKVFATSSIVKQHLRQVHTNDRPNVCNLCGATYKYLKSLKVHLTNHQKRVCPECGVGFSTMHEMRKHQKTHIKEVLPFQCGHCERTFNQRSKLTTHENLRGRSFQCDICCHSFNKQVYLTNHQRRCHWKEMGLERLRVAEPRNGWKRKGIPKPKRILKQPASAEENLSANSGFVDNNGKQVHNDAVTCETDLNAHSTVAATIVAENENSNAGGYSEYFIKSDEDVTDVILLPEISSKEVAFTVEESTQRSALICEQCGNRYTSATTLAVHRTRQHRSKRFQCDQCHRSFGFRCFLQRHIRTDHQNMRIACTLCDKQFKYPQDLKIHMRHHEDPKPFKCDQCTSEFRFPGALRSHRILHQSAPPFKCDICGKQFRFQNSLHVHKRLHLGIKEFKCSVCEREFSTKAPLLRHMKVHEDGRKQECTACGEVFYKKVDLVIHQSREHPGHGSKGKLQPIYTCEHCGKEFIKKSNLKVHTYIHEEVYRFQCKFCSQSFKQHAGLRNHMIKFHQQEKGTVANEPPGEQVELAKNSLVQKDDLTSV
uniref:C2H2-type domain-containing protein n=1 Tax=Anopheles dirus TaxID=7168 RepID=A0A182NV41_9DIPT